MEGIRQLLLLHCVWTTCAFTSISLVQYICKSNVSFLWIIPSTKFQSKKRTYKFVHLKQMTESPEATVSFKKCGKRLLWKWKVRRSCCDLCAHQAGRGGPVYFCWLDCHRGQQLLPLDTRPPCSERDLTECMHALHTGWLYSPDRKKRHQVVKSPLTMPFVWRLNKMKQTSRWGELLCAKKAESRQNFR